MDPVLVAESTGALVVAGTGAVFFITWVKNTMQDWTDERKQAKRVEAIKDAQAVSVLSDIAAGGKGMTDTTVKGALSDSAKKPTA